MTNNEQAILGLVKASTGIRVTTDYDNILLSIIKSEEQAVKKIGIVCDNSDEYLWLIAQRASFRWEHRHDKDVSLSPMLKDQTNDFLFYQKGNELS